MIFTLYEKDIRSTFSYLCTKHYPLKYVTNFSYGLKKLIGNHNAFCILLWRSQRLLNLNQNHCTGCIFQIFQRITRLAVFVSKSLHNCCIFDWKSQRLLHLLFENHNACYIFLKITALVAFLFQKSQRLLRLFSCLSFM